MAHSIDNKKQQVRILVAQEAARLMAEHGIRDYYSAKHKAASRLGIDDGRNLPRNNEIETARVTYQQLFKSRQQPRQLRHLRKTALQAMRLLSTFNPRLVGPVLTGCAGKYDAITLHLFADTAEEIAFALMEGEIPFTTEEYRLHLNGAGHSLPGYRFIADETDIELVVFPVSGIRQAPLGPVDRKPMQRASTHQVEQLLEQDSAGLAEPP